jgi:predicted O-methyltransferase YrrM
MSELMDLLAELEDFGQQNDATITDRPRRMLNITRDTGEFLVVLVKAMDARRVLEIGTSNGYSTLWLARAARDVGGAVTSVELSELKISLAKANFARSGLERFITLVHDNAGNVLKGTPEASVDLLFLDSERPEYRGWWPDLKRVLRPGGLLVVDNATSHAEQMAPFVALVTADPTFTTSLVPVGNGEFLAVKG